MASILLAISVLIAVISSAPLTASVHELTTTSSASTAPNLTSSTSTTLLTPLTRRRTIYQEACEFAAVCCLGRNIEIISDDCTHRLHDLHYGFRRTEEKDWQPCEHLSEDGTGFEDEGHYAGGWENDRFECPGLSFPPIDSEDGEYYDDDDDEDYYEQAKRAVRVPAGAVQAA